MLPIELIERQSYSETGTALGGFVNLEVATMGHDKLEPQVISITEVLRAAVEQTRSMFDRAHVQLTTAIKDTEYPMSADPVRLQQVFTNLLANAAKFTPPGGHVSVEAASTATTATVTVQDDGVGISPEFIPHVFDGLAQDPRTSAYTPRGLGVGLSIARHFVERHGGMIRATSDGPGKGATFTVVLPLHPQHTAVEERWPKDAAAGALRELSVLLVEDDEDARLLLTQTLNRPERMH